MKEKTWPKPAINMDRTQKKY